MTRLKRLSIVLGVLVMLGLALVGVLTLTRGTPVGSVITERGRPPAVEDSLFAQTIELYTGTHISAGNDAEILLNGNGTYPRLWADLRGARETITVQMYFSIPGAVADTMQAVLIERARAGVRVLLLLDAFGSQNLTWDWINALKAAGAEVALLRTIRWYTIHHAFDRSHVRVVVVDGEIGYTGGFGLADYWLGDGKTEGQWRETNVRFRGPTVMQLQAAFVAAWAEATGELLTGPLYFPRRGFDPAGTMNAGLFYAAPTTGSTSGERFLALTIASARRSLYITNSYFVPDDDLRRLLRAAAERGVDVRILTVSDQTDVKTTWYAGRRWYEQLLKAGVRIYEYEPTMMHAKSIVADGLWSTVGSMNFDNRSIAFNNESNLLVLDAGFGAELQRIFLDDLTRSREITLAVHAERSAWSRMLEIGASLLARVL